MAKDIYKVFVAGFPDDYFVIVSLSPYMARMRALVGTKNAHESKEWCAEKIGFCNDSWPTGGVLQQVQADA